MDTELGRLLDGVDFTTSTVIFVGDNGTPNEVTASPYKPTMPSCGSMSRA